MIKPPVFARSNRDPGAGAALAALIRRSYRIVRADLAAYFREEKEDCERMRADLAAGLWDGKKDLEPTCVGMNAPMDRINARIERMEVRMDGIEGMLHLHLGRNEDPAPLAPAE